MASGAFVCVPSICASSGNNKLLNPVYPVISPSFFTLDPLTHNEVMTVFFLGHKPRVGLSLAVMERHQFILNLAYWSVWLPQGYTTVQRQLKQFRPTKGDQGKKVAGLLGCDNVIRKNYLWTALAETYGREAASQLMPETWLLNEAEDHVEFLASVEPQQLYILKNNQQRKKGIALKKGLQISSLKFWFRQTSNHLLVQHYMLDPFCIHGYKLNLRAYVVLGCFQGQVRCYLYRNGKCLYTSKKYRQASSNFEEAITSYHL